jgi:hypothetical protein
MKVFVTGCLLLMTIGLSAQQRVAAPPAYDKFSIGIGIGMDYGGIGGNLLFYPQRNVGIFGGVGYAIAGVGYNVGGKFRLVSEKGKGRVVPYFMAMYGYNTAIAVTNQTDLNKLFYGPTFGLGIDLRGKRKSYWSIALVVPVRSDEVDKYIEDLKNNYGAEFKNDLLPVGFSFGYRFVIN